MAASKDLFDQLLREALALEELEVKEKVSSHEERPAPLHLEITTFRPDATAKKVSGTRILGWLNLITFLFLAMHLTLSCLEKDSHVRQSEFFLQARQRQAEVLTESLNGKRREARSLLRRLEAGEKEKALLEDNLRFLNNGLGASRKKTSLLTELVRRAPRGIWFWNLEMKRDNVRIRAFTSNQWLIRRFLRALGRSPHFQDPRLVSLEVYDFSRGIISFEIQC